jgi:uncharacterized membrane protein YesL
MGRKAIFFIIEWIWRLSWVNCLWLLFSVPVITIIPSTFAMYSVMMQLVKGEEDIDILPAFLKAFKKYLIKSFSLGITLALIGVFLYTDLLILKDQTENIMLILRYSIMILSVLFMPIAFYSISVFVEYETSWYKALSLAFILVMQRPFIVLMVICGIMGVFMLFLFWTGIGLLFVGSLCALFTTKAVVSGFQKAQ